MGHPAGAASSGLGGWISIPVRGWSSGRAAQFGRGGPLVMRELDDALKLSDLTRSTLRDSRRSKTIVHGLGELFRQSIDGKITHRGTWTVGHLSPTKVKRLYENFKYQAGSWGKPRHLID